jgi:hypothetical protein
MPTIEKRSYHCPTANVRVTLWRQTFPAVAGIGCVRPVQRDHDCSRAGTCPHRYTDTCIVQQLNR